jgi:thiamine transport system substrate-binding protein
MPRLFAAQNPCSRSLKKTLGVTLRITKAGDAGEMLNKLILTRANPVADVVFGIDNVLAGKAAGRASVLETLRWLLRCRCPATSTIRWCNHPSRLPAGCGAGGLWLCHAELRQGLVCQERPGALPRSLDDLAQPAYAKLLVVQNPATSSPGNAFLLATIGAHG